MQEKQHKEGDRLRILERSRIRKLVLAHGSSPSLVVTGEAGEAQVVEGVGAATAAGDEVLDGELGLGKLAPAVDASTPIGGVKTIFAAATIFAAHVVVGHRKYAPNE